MQKDRNQGIDVLRGLAALAVVLLHAREVLWVGLTQRLAVSASPWTDPDLILGMMSAPFRWGGWGVSLFFVISGYCIHRPYVKKSIADPAFRLPLGNYFARRIWRIYPVLIVTLLLTMLMDGYSRSHFPDDAKLGDNSWYCFAINAASLQMLLAPPYGSNGPLWTLAIEMQFYLVYPLFFRGIRGFGWKTTAIVIFLLSTCTWLALELTGQRSVFFLPYWFSWTTGAIVAELEQRGAIRLGWKFYLVGVICIGSGLLIESKAKRLTDSGPLLFTILSFPFAICVAHVVSGLSSRIWNHRIGGVFSTVGLFSYSLYAIHLPILVAWRAMILDGQQSQKFLSVIPGVAVSIAAAYLLYILVEQWTLKLYSFSKRQSIAGPALPTPHGELSRGKDVSTGE